MAAMNANARESILTAGRRAAQTHGYAGLNFRDLALEVGIKAASIHYYFPSKADLGAAVARRYWEDAKAGLEGMAADASNPIDALRSYPDAVFRRSLETGNRLCLCSFMSAEVDDLPDAVRTEVEAFADVNVAWLATTLVAAGVGTSDQAEARARAIFAAVSGAQLMARSRADLSLFDMLIETYRRSGLLPA
jgi:TetR/AcrR family transcriptional repressor of nem operon